MFQCSEIARPPALVVMVRVQARPAVESDGRHLGSGLSGCLVPASLAHGDERGGKIAGGAAGEARMNADGGVTDRRASLP
jgi:hypothetical protein